MTLHRLHLPTRKTGRNRRSMLEHLLRMEEELMKERGTTRLHTQREIVKRTMQQYTTEHRITHPFTYEEIQEYLRIASEQKKENQEEHLRGVYTSTLIEQIEDDTPLVIDLQGNTFNYLAQDLNTERPITIQNTDGDYIGCYAGSYQGNTNIHFKNINGSHTGWGMGSYKGKATVTFQNINGHWTGFRAGTDGNSTIVAYNIKGNDNFIEQNGILVLVNPNETPRIEGIDNTETYHQIQTLIAQNATPQEILDYIEANK